MAGRDPAAAGSQPAVGGRTWTNAALPKAGTGWRYVGARSATALVALADPATPVL